MDTSVDNRRASLLRADEKGTGESEGGKKTDNTTCSTWAGY